MQPLSPRAVAWAALLVVAFGGALAIDIFGIGLHDLSQSLGADFVVFWTASSVADTAIYDFDAITAAQAWLGISGVRPYVSPPSLLLWLEPLSRTPFWPAYAVWTVAGLSAFGCAAIRLVGVRAALLGMLSPSVIIAALAGQVTLHVAALVMASFTARRPWIRGLLFGIAATLKPQLVSLAPLALLAQGERKALLVCIAAGGALGLVALAIYGFSAWIDWIAAVAVFPHILFPMGRPTEGPTPGALAVALGLQGWSYMAFVWAGAALGAVVVWRSTRTAAPMSQRVAALGCGALLCTPYALNYDLALLAPCCAAMLLERRSPPLVWLGAALVYSNLEPALGVLLLAVALSLPRHASSSNLADEAGALAPAS